MKKLISIMLSLLCAGMAPLASGEQCSSGVPSKDHKPAHVLLRHIAGPDCVQNWDCENRNIIVFVHGIYGDVSTFQNNCFDFPSSLQKELAGRNVDTSIYRLIYTTQLLNWAKKNDLLFVDLANLVMETMKPVIESKPKSIGFVAHSLGGNVVNTYLVTTKLRYGHMVKARHAYLITLDTPFFGAQIADLAATIKSALLMPDDDLLRSLSLNNLYLEMLQLMIRYESSKGEEFGCRPTKLHVFYSKKPMYGVQVSPESSYTRLREALAWQGAEVDDPKGYDLNHAEIAKPENVASPVFQDVMETIVGETERIDKWEAQYRYPNSQPCRLDISDTTKNRP